MSRSYWIIGSNNYMNQITKTGLLLILAVPMLTFGVTVDPVHSFTKSQGPDQAGRLSPDSYGKANASIVCGDRLCSEVEEKKEQNVSFEVIDVYPISGERYKILIKVNGTPSGISEESELYASSDLSRTTISVPRIFANSHDYVSTIIDAKDPTTIKVTESKPGGTFTDVTERPYMKIIDISDISTQGKIYRVVIETFSGSENIQNIQVKMKSDSESMTLNTSGLWAESSNTSHVIIKASDPNSITGEVISFKRAK